MDHETSLRLVMFLGIFFLMAVWEIVNPKRALIYGKKRWLANLSIVILNSLIIRLLLPTGAVGAALWAASNDFGLLTFLHFSDVVTLLIAVIVLDFIIYAQHVMFHHVPLLWRLHQVHHADRDIDLTTGLRFHPLEILLSMLIKMGFVIILGVPVIAVIIFEITLNAMAMFNHSNIRLPKAIDAVIRLLFITPDVHRIHHSIIKNETNSNYGFNLSLWDKICGTYRAQPKLGHDQMIIGLADFQQSPTHQLSWMLRLPFLTKNQLNKPANKA
ncbi:MAG: sterol desaturase family protein [Mariprofundaceae bacterium]